MKRQLRIVPEMLYDEEGKKAGVLLKVKDFEKLMDTLEDLKDNLTVYKRTLGKKVTGKPAEQVWKKVLGDK